MGRREINVSNSNIDHGRPSPRRLVRRASAIGLLLSAGILGALTQTGTAAALTPASVSFFTGGSGAAGWVTGQDRPGETDNQAILLTAPDASSYGGANILGVGSTPPATPPSYWYKSLQSGASGGSPRLVIEFSDGGNIQLRPLNLIAGVWSFEDGAGSDWDSNGGSCPFVYEHTYAQVLACHSGATVTDAFVVVDQFGNFPSGLSVYIDDITYDGLVVTAGPAPCDPADRDNKADAKDAGGAVDGLCPVTLTTVVEPHTSDHPGSSFRDEATVSDLPDRDGRDIELPTGTVTFFLCGPTQVTSAGCPSGGTQIGKPRKVKDDTATKSDAAKGALTKAPGTYCWRAVYSGDVNYLPAVETNATSECFTITGGRSTPTPS